MDHGYHEIDAWIRRILECTRTSTPRPERLFCATSRCYVGHTRNHFRCIRVRVSQTPALSAPEVLVVSYCGLARPAVPTRLRRVGRRDEYDRYAHQLAEQQNSLPEEARRMPFPSDESRWILNRNASTRLLCHGHNPTGF